MLDEEAASSPPAAEHVKRFEGVHEGEPLPEDLLARRPRHCAAHRPLRRQRAAGAARLPPERGDLAAYEELRSGFTAAVSHELRTPLARLLSLLELALLPGEDFEPTRRTGAS